MFKLHAVQAEFGDCLLLEFGSQAAPRFVLIDGGPQTVYQNHLRSVLEPLGAAGHRLDLVMLSHVDIDHVAGLIDLFSELRDQQANSDDPLIRIDGLWHNSFDRAIDPDASITPRLAAAFLAAGSQAASVMSDSDIALQGVKEGNTLRVLSLQLGIPLNSACNGEVITTETANAPIAVGELELTVVGPTTDNLNALHDEWIRWLDANEDAITNGDPLVMANADRSIPNLSSISVVAKADGKTILLTGDARSDHILDGLKSAGLTDNQGQAHFDVFKLPHHGSDRNITKTFFRKVTADVYVVSANGKHDNPDLATLIWLVEAAKESARIIEIVATNVTISATKLTEEYPPQEYGYTLRFRAENEHLVTVDLS